MKSFRLPQLDRETVRAFFTRNRIELGAFLLIGLFASSIFFLRLPSQKTVTLDDGTITYTGSVVADKMSGKGKMTFSNGDTYEGEFKNGVFDGEGAFTGSTGWTYVGEFKNGQADGKGTLTTEDNTVYKGTFEQGIYQHEN